MSKKVISIEIGLQSIKICEVSLKKNNPRLYRGITFPTPDNMFNDGYIRDNNRLALLLKEKIKEAKIRSKRVIFTITSTKIASREVILPPVREAKIPKIISTNASEYFPVDLSNYTIAYRVLERTKNKDNKKVRLFLLAAPNNLIENYYSLAKLMGLKLIATDYVGNSSYQILKSQVSEGSNLFIQIGDHSSLVSVIDNGILMLQRTISSGEVELSSQYHRLDEADLEAAATMDSYYEEDDNSSNPYDVKGAITDSHRYFVSNILRILNYNHTVNNKRVDAIYLTSNGSKIVGLDELINNETGIEVKKLESIKNLTLRKKLMKKLSANGQGSTDYLVGVGASIYPLQFVPSEVLLKAKRKITISNRIAIILGSFIIGAIITVSSYLEYQTALMDKEAIGRDIDNVIDINELYNDYIESKKLYDQMLNVDSLSTSPNRRLNDLIKELEDKLPEKASITTMVVTSTDITISVEGDSKEMVAKTLQTLKNISYITDISTKIISENSIGNDLKEVDFVVSAKYDLTQLKEELDNE